MNKNGAFTLIELLIVIGIIAVLSAITFAFLGSARNQGDDAGKIQAMTQIRNALQLYTTDKGGFPDTLAELVSANDIGSINKSILYAGTNADGSVCSTSPCPSYHLAVPLGATNKVLSSDSEATTGGIDGTVDNCVSGVASTPDLCYDITP